MKTLKYLAVAVAALVALAINPIPVHAQDVYGVNLARLLSSEPAGNVIGADDTDTALLVRYIGPNASGTVTIAANAITFKSGASGAEAADTSMECPVSGALGGIIDLTNAACDTLAEVVDTLNASGSWRAVILDGVRTDATNIAGTSTLNALAETTANSKNGLALKWDTSVALTVTAAVIPQADRVISAYLDNRNNALTPSDPNINKRDIVLKANATSTYGAGTSTFSLISCKQKLSAATGTASETCSTLYSEAGGATTVNKVFDFTSFGALGGKSEKLIARVTNSSAMSSVVFRVYGLQQRYQ